MMKEFYLILTILFCIFASQSRAQRSNGLTVEGAVSVEQGSVDGAIIEMYRNGQPMGNYGIGSNGRYRVEQNYNNEFVLIFSRRDNFSQKIVVDTHVPQSVLQSDPIFPPFPVNIKLFTEIAGIDKTFSENTVMKIYYSDRVDNFISDLFYNDAQIKRLIDQAILQSKQIDREADYLAGLTKAELAELRKEYDQLIKEAENEYNREEFLSALDGYKAASKIFPKEQYPLDRIAEINDLLGLLMVASEMEKALADRLQALIKQGDAQFEQKKYEEARASYQRAVSVDAGNSHAINRLKEIDEIISGQETDREYNNLIVSADNSFDELLYAEARNSYLKALELKPNENYPQQKIRDIDNILNQQARDAEKLKGYRESVFQAELNFERQFYDKAISYYENALVHKPGDETAVQKIEEIKALMSHLANKTLYDKRIKAADRAFQRKQYVDALAEYGEAARLIPGEEYPQSQMDKINTIFAEQERLAAEAEAEKARLAAEAEAAEQARLASLEAEKARLAAEVEAAEQARLVALEAEKERQYNRAIASADSLFSLNEYESSRSAYQSALQVKPDELLPGQKIEEINQLIGRLAAAQQAYNAAISRADGDFQQESFENARTAYLEAQKIKPKETYPLEMLAQIDSIEEARAQLAAEAEAEKARLAAEAEASEQARLATLEAEKKRQYNQAIASADSLFSLNEYENSRSAYQAALQINPDESLPGQKIEEINQLIDRLAAAQHAYEAAISRADGDFQQESFENAKTAYMEAQKIKPEETYPQEMLAQIDSIVEARAQLAAEAEAEKARLAAEAEAAEQARLATLEAEKQRQYNHAIASADSLFILNEYENSRSAYQAALQVNPDESLPGQKIEEINQLIDRLAAAQQAYEAAISRADGEFHQESFENARANYLEAQQIKPEENYPQEMLAQIDSIVEARAQLAAEAEAEKARLAAEAEAAEQARLTALEAEKQRQYNQAIASADSLFSLSEYENSRSAYQAALQVKPDENIPQQRIVEVNKILHDKELAQKELEKLNQDYLNAIQMADQQFNAKDFRQAIAGYETALGIKPEESYPKERIAEVDRLMKQMELDENYSSIILAADGYFQSESWSEARTEYENALEVKPNENYPRSQIDKINNLFKQIQEQALAEERAAAEAERRRIEIKQRQQALNDRQELNEAGLNQMYKEYITLANNYFVSKNYNVSRAWYYKAWDVKQDEAYPQQRIEEINRLVGSLLLNQRDRDYQHFVDLADSTFRTNQLAVSRGWYNRAISVKPEENYPKEQLQSIADLIAERMAGRSGEQFNSHMGNAAEAFENGNLNVARYWYRKALELRPDDKQALEGLNNIQNAIN